MPSELAVCTDPSAMESLRTFLVIGAVLVLISLFGFAVFDRTNP